MSEITQFPWTADRGNEAYDETKSAIGSEPGLYVEQDREYGALFYAGVANVASDFMEYPDEVKVKIDNDIQEEADKFVGMVAHDRSKGTGKALYSLCADVHDHTSHYRTEYGQRNVQPIIIHFRRIRDRVYESQGIKR